MKSEQINELVTALSKAQGKMKEAELDGSNPHFGGNYSTLASVVSVIRKPFEENGLCFTQLLEKAGQELELVTTIYHLSGQWISCSCPLWADKRSMQALGSAITYAKRYTLQAMVGVASSSDPEEDDGNGAGKGQGKEKVQAQRPAPVKNLPKPKDEPAAKPGDFVMHHGQTTKGKRIADCDMADLQKALAWLKGQPASKMAKSDIEMKEAIQAYFYELELDGGGQ